ncbi:hypothetical protein [Streptomyces sp. NPDC020489]
MNGVAALAAPIRTRSLVGATPPWPCGRRAAGVTCGLVGDTAPAVRITA